MNTSIIAPSNIRAILLKYQLFLHQINEQKLPTSVLVNQLASDLEGFGISDNASLSLAMELMPPTPEFLNSANLTLEKFIIRELTNQH